MYAQLAFRGHFFDGLLSVNSGSVVQVPQN